MNCYDEIKNELLNNEINRKVKNYSINRSDLNTYYSKHTGQIQNYMNYIDKNVKEYDDNKTVEIITCKQNNQYVIDYCSDDRIISREYELIILKQIILFFLKIYGII